jgi:hypothetical protein
MFYSFEAAAYWLRHTWYRQRRAANGGSGGAEESVQRDFQQSGFIPAALRE